MPTLTSQGCPGIKLHLNVKLANIESEKLMKVFDISGYFACNSWCSPKNINSNDVCYPKWLTRQRFRKILWSQTFSTVLGFCVHYSRESLLTLQSGRGRRVCLKQKASFIPQEWFLLHHILHKWVAPRPLAWEQGRNDLWVSTYESVSRRANPKARYPAHDSPGPNTLFNTSEVCEEAQRSHMETANYSR